MVPSRARVPSAGKVTETSQDLERFLFGFQQRRRISTNAEQRVRPLRTGRTLRMEAERGGVKKDALALYLLDHWALGQDLFERLSARQAPVVELQPAQLRQRVILVLQCRLDPVLGAEIAHEDRKDEGIGLVAGHLEEAGRARVCDVFNLEMAEVLHLEQSTRAGAGHPRRPAAPGPSRGQRLELGVHALEPLLGKPVQAIVEDPTHSDLAYR